MPNPKQPNEADILEEAPNPLDSLRQDLQTFAQTTKDDVLNAVRTVIAEASKPNTDKIPAPDLSNKPSGIKVTGHGTDVLYANLPDYERPYRTRQLDALAIKWMTALVNGDFESRRHAANEIRDLCLTNEITAGTADANGGIGSGTGADLLPVPLQALITVNRARVAKTRARARVINWPSGQGQSGRLPRFGGVTAEVVAESSPSPNSGNTFDSKIFSLKKFQVRGEVTREMLRFSPFSVITEFTRDAGQRFGDLEDREFWTPRGQAASITQSIEAVQGQNLVTPKTAGRVTYNDMVALRYAALEQYRSGQGIYANSQGLQLLSSVLDGNGRPIFTPYGAATLAIGDSQLPGFQGTVLGMPVAEVPTTISGVAENLASIWAVDLNEYVIIDGGAFEVRVSEHIKFLEGHTVVLIETYMDGLVNDQKAFSELPAISGTNNSAGNDLIFS